MRERLPLPDRIQNAPDLWIGLELYYDAFWDLGSCRGVGWGLGPIPWTAINDYATAYEFTPEQREDLMYYIREMDGAYLKTQAGKGTKPVKTGKWGTGRGN